MAIRYISILIVFLAAGCSKEATMPTSPENTLEEFLALSPTDGETSIRLDAPVVLLFTKPVARAAVERGFHLIGERAMADSTCPISRTMGHGNMMGSMIDSSKMRHLDQYHSTKGKFMWNTDSTRCTFQPDSMMTPRTQYMIHMDREMTQMMEQQRGGMGMTGGHGTGMMSGEMLFHFFTMDTTKSGNSHSQHH